MKNSMVAATLASVIALAGSEAAHAQAACYLTELFPDERIVVDVEKQGILVNSWTDLVALVFGGKQIAYKAHGKTVVAEEMEGEWIYSMAAVTGTVDVSSPFLLTNGNSAMHPTQLGAHMGLVATWVRGDEYGESSARPYHFDCGSDEQSPTPATWHCQSYNDFGDYWGAEDLTKVANPAADARCNLFEGLIATPVTPTAYVNAVGSGGKGRMLKK